MKKLSQDPMQLAAVIAHQLKSPVTSAMATLQTVLGEYAGPLTPKQRELIEKALARCQDSLSSAQRLLAITQALEKPETFGGVADLRMALRQVESRYREQATAQQIKLSFARHTEAVFARGYEPALAEVVEALVHNALKYTPDHGHIEVAVGPSPHEKMVRIQVADSGGGVPEKDRDTIFQAFTRTPAARKSSRPGAGLGLAFVKAVVEAAGGSIGVARSHLGGAEFHIDLPIAYEEPAPTQGARRMSEAFKVLIIGGVAAGPKVAAKVMRLRPDAEVTIVDKGKFLSYAGCGLPYYVSGAVQDQNQLMSTAVGVLRDPVFFQKVKNVHIMNQTEALQIDRNARRVLVREQLTGKESYLDYDKLVLATGANPFVPDIPGRDASNVFTLHGVSDAEGIRGMLESRRAHDVVIVGGGLIGIEITEALASQGCRVTIVEQRDQILRVLDWEMAKLVEQHLERSGVRVLTGTKVKRLDGGETVNAVVTDHGVLPADLVILAIGVQPNTELARTAELEIGVTGGVKVDHQLRTSDPDIYAAGDCIQTTNLITGLPAYAPFGSVANKQGRVVAMNLCGEQDAFTGTIFSCSCNAFDFAVARTGLTEHDAREHGFDPLSVLAPAPDAEPFIPDVGALMFKMIVDRQTRRLLGAQAIGPGDAEKRINVVAMAIANGMTIDQLANMDLCYAPQFSPVMDHTITAANIARNKLAGAMDGISAAELNQMVQDKKDIILLDVRTVSEYQAVRLPQSTHIPLGALRERLAELSPDKLVVAFCNYSLRGYEAALILKAADFENIRVLDGGLDMWPYEKVY